MKSEEKVKEETKLGRRGKTKPSRKTEKKLKQVN